MPKALLHCAAMKKWQNHRKMQKLFLRCASMRCSISRTVRTLSAAPIMLWNTLTWPAFLILGVKYILKQNKLASSVDAIAISKIWKHYWLTDWLTQSEGEMLSHLKKNNQWWWYQITNMYCIGNSKSLITFIQTWIWWKFHFIMLLLVQKQICPQWQ